jgi:hypothetical protein
MLQVPFRHNSGRPRITSVEPTVVIPAIRISKGALAEIALLLERKTHAVYDLLDRPAGSFLANLDHGSCRTLSNSCISLAPLPSPFCSGKTCT